MLAFDAHVTDLSASTCAHLHLPFVLFREVSEEVDSIKQFSSELLVEAVVRCVRAIDPGLGATLPTSLPPGMSARFRVGMSLAQACQVGAAVRGGGKLFGSS